MRSKKFVLAVLLPTFAFISVFLILPIFSGVAISLLDYNPLRSANAFVGFANFAKLMEDTTFWVSLRNTLVFVGGGVACNIIIAVVIAHFITTFQSGKVRAFFRLVVFLPCIAPMAASGLIWGKSILSTKNGLFNIILNSLGIGSINWLGNPEMIITSMIIYTIWADIGYNIILFSAGMDNIPDEVYQAADLDGANAFHKFFKITIPLLARTMLFVTIMTMISWFQMFAQFSVMLAKNTPQNSGLVLTKYIYQTAFQNKDMGYASAIAVALLVIILLITLVQQRLQKVDWEY